MKRISYDSDGNCTIVVHKEDDLFVADCPSIGIVSQGATTTEALKNLKEAIDLYLEVFSTRKFHEIIVAIIEENKENYSAYSPHLPGCVATGDTYDEVLSNLSDAVVMHLESLGEESPNLFQTFSLASYVIS